MPSRVISGLQWARPCAPVHSRIHGATAVRRLGLAYEKKVGEALPHAIHGLWFTFRDSHGLGYCQPDFILVSREEILIIEAKLTYTSGAWTQLRGLYLPVVKNWLGAMPQTRHLPIRGVQICKNLTNAWPREQIGEDFSSQMPLVHWLGHTPLTTQTIPFPKELLAQELRDFYK